MHRNQLALGAATCSMKMLQDPQHFLKAALRTRDATENQCADRSVDAVVGNWQCVCRADSDLDRHTHSAGFLAKVKLHETIGLHAHPAHPVWQQVAEIHSRTRSDLEHDPGNVCKHSSLVLRYETLVTRVETGKRPRKNSLSEPSVRDIHPSHSHPESLRGIVPVTLSSTQSLRGGLLCLQNHREDESTEPDQNKNGRGSEFPLPARIGKISRRQNTVPLGHLAFAGETPANQTARPAATQMVPAA